MSYPLRIGCIHSATIAIYCLMLAGTPFAFELNAQSTADNELTPALVRVNIIVETRGAGDTVEINGKIVSNYSPIIIKDFPSTGIVLDHQNHIMTFLGYRWVDIHNAPARILISAGEGQKLKGKLIGIDQSNGVAVIRMLEGKLPKTPICIGCEVKNGIIVMAPAIDNSDKSVYREAQILSVGTGPNSLDPGAWVMKMNRPFRDIGLPILTKDRRVLGFIADLNPMEMQTVVYPIAQLLSSAEKILKAGGDIRTGWLGVIQDASYHPEGQGIRIRNVEENSPAQKAGLHSGDILLKLDGREIRDALQFVQLIQNIPIGSNVQLDIIRQGHPLSGKNVLIEARKSPQIPGRLSFSLAGAFDPAAKGIVPELKPRNPRLLMGLSTEILTAPLADALQIPGKTGLLVLGVASKMPADMAGVLPGDVIVAIDGQPIIDASGFTSFLLTHVWDSRSVLKVLRKGIEHTIVVQIPSQD